MLNLYTEQLALVMKNSNTDSYDSDSKKEKSQFTDQTLATSYNLMSAFSFFEGKANKKHYTLK
jgi:hypothetical protein